jgi:1,2-diacylglycerol 3-alpha-glucosyltransferase
MHEPARPVVRVLLVCTGLGIIHRGIETFFREAFDGLKRTEGLELRIAKGAGPAAPDERPIWNLPRTGIAARFIGAVLGRNGYTVEQWTSLFSVLAQIRNFRPHLVFYSDANLGFLLHRFRGWRGGSYRLLFSNGGPVHPPFVRTDYVQQIVPCYHEEALLAGEPAAKHFLVPYGIAPIPAPAHFDADDRAALRRRLGMPTERTVVLSVGWVRSVHKRMDYVIQEVARLPQPRPFLQLVGAIDRGSREIISLGNRLLGENGFAAHSVPYERVFDYYRAVDCFVLASLKEGFGRVYLEALMHGLPTIAHRNAVTEYVLGSFGILRDLLKPGTLADALANELSKKPDTATALARWDSIQNRFGWPKLAEAYLQMFRACAFPASK